MIETQDLLLENKNLQNKLIQSQSEIAYLKYQLDQLKRQVFGVKRERYISMLDAGQLVLPIEDENPPVIEEEEDTITVEAHDRKKNKKKANHSLRKPFPADLPRQVEKIFPPGFDENSLEKPIGEEITEILEEIPGKFYVRQIIRYKFANKETGGVVIGELPSRVNEKGMFGESVMTRIIIDKYCDHLPGYRQEQRFSRVGIKIPYSTLMDVPRQVGNYMVPLYEELKKVVLTCKYLQIDETPHPVLDKETKGKTHRGYLWVYRSVE